jgi:nucleoside-diphosphate kinase
METTLIILKPDAVQRGLVGRIIGRFEDKGLQIRGAKLVRIGRDLAERLYEPHRGKPFYERLIKFMTSSPVLALAVGGVGAIDVSRKLMGTTFGSQAAAGTIRGDFGVSNSYNLIHGSDGPESARRELQLFFEPAEVLDYDRAVEGWVYDLSGAEPE